MIMVKRTRLGKSMSSRKKNRLVKQYPFGDFDRDGVSNISDCAPFDPKRHGIEPSETTWKRLEALPIFVTDKAVSVEKRKFPEMIRLMKGAEPNGNVARQRFLSIIKHYPAIVGEMEKQKPVQVLITSVGEYRKKMLIGGVAYRMQKKGVFNGIIVMSPREGIIVIRLPSKYRAKKPWTKFTPEVRKFHAETLFHELAHLGQHRKWGGGKLERRMFAGRYAQRRGEREAREFAKKKIKEREEPLTRAQARRALTGFQQMFE